MTDCIGLVYAKTQSQQLGPIWLCVVFGGNWTRQRRYQSYKCGLH